MGEAMGGDTDDYILSKYGIPAVTAELGEDEMYVNNWTCRNQQMCYNIMNKNTLWMEYLFSHVDQIAKVV